MKKAQAKFLSLEQRNYIKLKIKKKDNWIKLFKKPQIRRMILKWNNKLKILKIKRLSFHQLAPSYHLATRIHLSLLLIRLINSLSLIKLIPATVKRIQVWFTFLMCKMLKQSKLIWCHLILTLWELNLAHKYFQISDRIRKIIKFCSLQKYLRQTRLKISILFWFYKSNVI